MKSDMNRKQETVQLPLERLHRFPEHPYKVEDNEEMEALTESIREYGILNPLLVRRITSTSTDTAATCRMKTMASLSAADMFSCRGRGNWTIFSARILTWISPEQGGIMKTNINAIIQSKNGNTLVLDFPRSIYDLYEKLQSVGIRQSPHRIPLSDEDGDDVRVKLYSESELGKHLLLALSDRNTLADANLLAFIVDNAREEIRPALEQNILRNQYSSMQEVVDVARQPIQA